MYHNPVLLTESVDALAIRPEGCYVDVTFGGGGHSRKILEQLGPEGRLYAFDQDADARANILDDPRFTLIPHNFRYLKRFLRLEGVRKVDGILADFGVSSHQFDEATRGFSFRFEAALDMRMNQHQTRQAQDVLADYSAADLQTIFSRYGELRNARTAAQRIVQARAQKPIETTQELIAVLDPIIRGKRNRYLSQVFQALRMEVNEEVAVIEELLTQAVEVLKPEGRFVSIAYHSIEDRLVKHFFKKGVFHGEPEKDVYGRFFQPFKLVWRKVLEPTAEEIEENPRARSAKLRVAARTEEQPKSNPAP